MNFLFNVNAFHFDIYTYKMQSDTVKYLVRNY